MARDDVLICLSHSGRTTEMVDVTRRVRARGGHVLAITGDARSPLATIADVHLHAAVHTSEYLGAGACLLFLSISTAVGDSVCARYIPLLSSPSDD